MLFSYRAWKIQKCTDSFSAIPQIDIHMKKFLIATWLSSLLILARSIFRTVEMAEVNKLIHVALIAYGFVGLDWRNIHPRMVRGVNLVFSSDEPELKVHPCIWLYLRGSGWYVEECRAAAALITFLVIILAFVSPTKYLSENSANAKRMNFEECGSEKAWVAMLQFHLTDTSSPNEGLHKHV